MRKIICLLLFGLLLVSPVLGQGALNYGDNALGSLSATAPLAFYSFSGTAGDLVTVEVIGITPGLDPAVSLNSPTQQQLASNDNDPGTPGTTDARIALSLPQSGAFTILVSSVTGAPGDFLVRLNGQAPPPSTALAGDAPAAASVSTASPPLFSFSADPVEIITLNVATPSPGFSFRATITDANGEIVALVNGSDVVGVSVPFAPGTGTYTVKVTPIDPNVTGQVLIALGGPPATAPAAPTAPPPGNPTVPPPAETEEVLPALPTGVCGVSPNQGNVNLRNAPVIEPNNIISQLQPSQVLEVTGTTGEWYQVTVPGVGTAWVAASVVFTTGDCSNVPAVTAPEQQPAPTATTSPTQPVQQATPTYTPSYTPTTAQQQQQATATYTPSYTPTTAQQQQQPTATYTPSYTPTTPPAAQVAPEDARFNNQLNIQLDSTASVLDFVSYPGGDREDRVRWDIIGMNNNSSLPGGRARLVISVSCFGQNTNQVQFFTGGQTYSCGQTIVDQEVTANSKTGSVVITAVGGSGTYVQWVLTGTATRVN